MQNKISGGSKGTPPQTHLCASILMMVFLAIIYSRNFLFSKDILPGGERNDFYFTEGVTKLWSNALKQGVIPVATFWIKDLYGGGYPNAWTLGGLSSFVLSIPYIFLHDFFLSLKLLLFVSLVLAGITSYYYGLIVTKRWDASLIFSVGYTYSSYLFTEFYFGHANLILGVAIIPLVLALWERNLSFPSTKNAVLSGLSLALLFMTELQLTFFITFFLFFRFLWRLLSRPFNLDLFKDMIFCMTISAVTFILLAFPVFAPLLAFYEIRRSWSEVVFYLFYPYSFFLRPTRTELAAQNIAYGLSYVGVFILVLMVAPIFLKLRSYLREVSFSSRPALREFPFYLAMFIFYLFLASGWHAPVDITSFVYRIFPFSSSIRVYPRCSILVYLSSSISASVGYITLMDAFARLRASTHIMVSRAIAFGKKIKISLLVLLVVLFLDLSYGFEPGTTPIFQPTDAYHYLQYDHQPFRVVEMPVMWGVSYYSSSYIGHPIIASDSGWLAMRAEPQIQSLESIFADVPSKMFIKNGGFEQNMTQWGIDLSALPECSGQIANVSLHGQSSLLLSIRSDRKGAFAKVFQVMSSQPPVTKNIQIFFSIFLERFEEAQLDVSLTFVNKASNDTFSLVYCFACDHSDANSAYKMVVKELNYTLNSWDRFHRNILEDSDIQGESWYIDKLEICVTNRAANGQENDVVLYIDDVAVCQQSETSVLSAIYGVKYVLLHTGEAFYEKWRLLTVSSIETDAVELYLNLAGFEKVYQYENDSVYENKNFRGYLFAVKSDFPMFCSNVDSIPLADADVNYVWKDANTIAISVSAKEPILLIISQTFHKGWRASDGNQTFTISEIFGVMGIPLRPGTYFITLHFCYYEESLLLFPAFYVPLLLLIPLAKKRRGGSFSRKALRRLVIAPLSFYGLALAAFFLTLGFSLSPFGYVIIWLAVSIVAGMTLLFLLAEARDTKLLSTQTIALASVFTALVVLYWLSIQESLLTSGILFLLMTIVIASCVNIFQCFFRPLTLRDSPTFLEAARRIYRQGSRICGASAAFMKARVKALIGVGLVSLTVKAVVLLALTLALTCVHSPMLFRGSLAEVYRQTSVDNKPLLVLVGYRIKDPYVEQLMWTGLLILGVLSAYVFLANYRRALLSTTNLGLFCAFSALYFKYRLTLQEYTAHIPINVLENEFLPMLVAIYIASNMLLLHALHRPMIFREEVTVSSLLTNQVLKCLALLTLGLTLTANFLQPFFSSLASFVAVGAFYFFLSSAFLYMVRGVYVYLTHRRREGLRIS